MTSQNWLSTHHIGDVRGAAMLEKQQHKSDIPIVSSNVHGCLTPLERKQVTVTSDREHNTWLQPIYWSNSLEVCTDYGTKSHN